MIEYKKPSVTVDIIIFNENVSISHDSNNDNNNNNIKSNNIDNICKNSQKLNEIDYANKNEFILIKRRNEPFKNHWAIPGGFVDYGEKVENAAVREAKEETGINIRIKKLVGVYSDPNRDPRGHTITIAYLAVGDFDQMKADSDAVDVNKYSFNDIKSMEIAFDHKNILKDVFNQINSDSFDKYSEDF